MQFVADWEKKQEIKNLKAKRERVNFWKKEITAVVFVLCLFATSDILQIGSEINPDTYQVKQPQFCLTATRYTNKLLSAPGLFKHLSVIVFRPNQKPLTAGFTGKRILKTCNGDNMIGSCKTGEYKLHLNQIIYRIGCNELSDEDVPNVITTMSKMWEPGSQEGYHILFNNCVTWATKLLRRYDSNVFTFWLPSFTFVV